MKIKAKYNFRNNLISENKNIYDAMLLFNKTNKPIAFVINKQKKLLGSISDGDIRRAILKKIDFKQKLKKIMNKNPILLDIKDSENIEKIKTLMKSNYIRFIPVLNNNKIINIIDREEIEKPEKLNYDIVIMAGGEGKRLMPLTKKTPKPLLKIGDKSILKRVIENFKNDGFNNFNIIINYLGSLIVKEISEMKDKNTKITFIEEKKKLGTIGGLSLINKKISKNFILVNADILTNLSIKKMIKFHEENNCFATIGCINQKHEVPYGVINYKDNKFVNIVEKPIYNQFINAGIYIFNKKVIKKLKKNIKLDVPEFLNTLSEKIKIFPIYEDWIDIGTHNNFEIANKKNG